MRDSSVEMLHSYLTSIIESIVGSVDQCPPVMRVAFKQLHKRVEEQFAEPENEVSLEHNAQKENSLETAFQCIFMDLLHIIHSAERQSSFSRTFLSNPLHSHRM